MSVTRLIELATAHGVAIFVQGGSVHLRAESPPPAELLDQLKAHKAELLAELKHRHAASHSYKPMLYLLALDSGQILQRFSPDSMAQVQERTQAEYGDSLLKVVAVPKAQRFLTDEELPKALAGTWEVSERSVMRPHALLVRVANLLGCSGDYLLEKGFLEPCDLEEQAHTDPWIIAEGIRLDPRWQPPSKAAQTYVEPSEGQGLPEPHQTHWSAAIASADWLQARDAFHNHIFGCSECYPPLGRYCSIGQVLHQHYQDCHG